MPHDPDLRFGMRRLNQSTTLHVQYYETGEWKIRVWLFLRLMKLAAWVIGSDFRVSYQPPEDPERYSREGRRTS